MKDQLNLTIKTFYYLLLTVLHIYMYSYLRATFPEMTFYGRLLFLTNISFYLNGFYYMSKFLSYVPILNAVFTNFDEKSRRKIFRFGFSLSFVVSFLYWGMRLADPKMLLASGVVIPIDLDLFLHGANFGLNFLEHIVITPEHNYDSSLKDFIIFSIFYSILLKVALLGFGITTYPFVAENSGFVYLAVVCIGVLLMLSGDLIFRGISKINEKRSRIKLSTE